MEDIQSLTAEQSKLVEDNHNLIYSFLHSRGLSTDEAYDIAAIGLCHAAIEWSPSKGAFSTIAYLMMGQEIIRENITSHRHNVEPCVSLDEIASGKFDDDRTLHQLLPRKKGEYEHCSVSLQLQQALPYCSKRELSALHLLLLEYRKVDIAASMNTTRKNVHNIVVRLRDKINRRGNPRRYATDDEREKLFRQIARAVSYHVAC